MQRGVTVNVIKRRERREKKSTAVSLAGHSCRWGGGAGQQGAGGGVNPEEGAVKAWVQYVEQWVSSYRHAFAAPFSKFVSEFPRLLHFIILFITFSNFKFDLSQPSHPPLLHPLVGGVTSQTGSESMKNLSSATQRRRAIRQQRPANMENFWLPLLAHLLERQNFKCDRCSLVLVNQKNTALIYQPEFNGLLSH